MGQLRRFWLSKIANSGGFPDRKFGLGFSYTLRVLMRELDFGLNCN